MRKTLAVLTAAIVTACSPAYAETKPFDLSTIDIIADLSTGDYILFFTRPGTRPCFDTVEAWWVDAQARGYTGLPVANVGINRITGEPVEFLMILDEPARGETWAVLPDDPRLCLHIVVEQNGI